MKPPAVHLDDSGNWNWSILPNKSWLLLW